MKRSAVVLALLLALSPSLFAAPNRDDDGSLIHRVVRLIKRIAQPFDDILLPPRP